MVKHPPPPSINGMLELIPEEQKIKILRGNDE
jgi:hypothetical protein